MNVLALRNGCLACEKKIASALPCHFCLLQTRSHGLGMGAIGYLAISGSGVGWASYVMASYDKTYLPTKTVAFLNKIH